ncbi:MAG: heavy metal translocating P-type ATPase [Burkholderiaceae bacterium]|nr:heavy metal translocating P-type ATPase [Burkholderiaceae bacterium]
MSELQKLRLDLPLVLPDVDDVEDRCVERLLGMLAGRSGIDEAHVVREEGATPQLCIHYDPDVTSLSRVRELAHSAGADLSERFSHLLIQGDQPLHARAARGLADDLRSVTGVLEADVAASSAVRIEYDRQLVSADALLDRVGEFGNRLSKSPDSPRDEQRIEGDADEQRGHAHGHGGPFGEKSELVFAATAGTLLAAGWLIERFAAGPSWLPTACYIVAYGFGGFHTLKEAIGNLRARRFEIDSLMLLAAIGAAVLGKWAEGALLLFLFSIGHALERYAMGRARTAIEALAELAPETATVRRERGTEVVGVEQLQVGDVVIVRPNERLPADGVVVVGQTSVNQAPVTGESVPVDKRPLADAKDALATFDRVAAEHRVFAGTINGSGVIEVMVARRAEQSTMARVVTMVAEAQAQRSPTQQFTERFERVFVPLVLALVVLLLLAGVVVDEPFADSFYRAMAVLVAASPCALAISVPSAVLSGVARAARSGVLVKGGGPLENLGTLNSIAFDKTGTLTEGKPRLTDVVPMPGSSENELLAVALAVEEHSDHPLATAIVSGARERMDPRVQVPVAADVESITGRGVQAMVEGERVYIAKPVLFSELPDSELPPEVAAANDRLVASGRTTMAVRKGERFLGVIGVMDTPRPAAAQLMAELRALGIERLIMISGDNQQVAEAVARSVGLTEARGDLMPEQKVEAIQSLRREHGKVAMVGDGVNDAPAMANATVGIAMGAAGSDVALETADVALMADDLAQLPFAVGLSRSTSRIIRQNLYVSLGVVAVLIPATILGLNIGTAVLFHEGSTLIVVANALRLLAYGLPSSRRSLWVMQTGTAS